MAARGGRRELERPPPRKAYRGARRRSTPSIWAQVHVVVPAKVKLIRVSPGRLAWGDTVRITGQLLGGYLPPGGALVRLRIDRARFPELR